MQITVIVLSNCLPERGCRNAPFTFSKVMVLCTCFQQLSAEVQLDEEDPFYISDIQIPQETANSRLCWTPSACSKYCLLCNELPLSVPSSSRSGRHQDTSRGTGRTHGHTVPLRHLEPLCPPPTPGVPCNGVEFSEHERYRDKSNSDKHLCAARGRRRHRISVLP